MRLVGARGFAPRPQTFRAVPPGFRGSQPGTIWGRQPAMVLALARAVIALVVAFGRNLAPDQIGTILVAHSDD